MHAISREETTNSEHSNEIDLEFCLKLVSRTSTNKSVKVGACVFIFHMLPK